MKKAFSITKTPRTPRITKEFKSPDTLGVLGALVMESACFNTQPLRDGMPT
jgi:hypothetical protein